mgnify:CR=1 FL=1
MTQMEVYRPTCLDDALQYMWHCSQAQGNAARPIAGGTDLMVAARHAAEDAGQPGYLAGGRHIWAAGDIRDMRRR